MSGWVDIWNSLKKQKAKFKAVKLTESLKISSTPCLLILYASVEMDRKRWDEELFIESRLKALKLVSEGFSGILMGIHIEIELLSLGLNPWFTYNRSQA